MTMLIACTILRDHCNLSDFVCIGKNKEKAGKYIYQICHTFPLLTFVLCMWYVGYLTDFNKLKYFTTWANVM